MQYLVQELKSNISPQNMIGQSQSGTGKTAAFVLTMLSRVDFSKNKPQVRDHYLYSLYMHLNRMLTLPGPLSCPISRTCTSNHVRRCSHGQIYASTD